MFDAKICKVSSDKWTSYDKLKGSARSPRVVVVELVTVVLPVKDVVVVADWVEDVPETMQLKLSAEDKLLENRTQDLSISV